MPKERLYSDIPDNPPSLTNTAERAFFRWQYTLGSYEYARRHGTAEEVRALHDELLERYETYVALRDKAQVAAAAGDSAPPPSAKGS